MDKKRGFFPGSLDIAEPQRPVGGAVRPPPPAPPQHNLPPDKVFVSMYGGMCRHCRELMDWKRKYGKWKILSVPHPPPLSHLPPNGCRCVPEGAGSGPPRETTGGEHVSVCQPNPSVQSTATGRNKKTSQSNSCHQKISVMC